MEPYKIIHPDTIYCGKTYSDLVSDWLNWFFSADADKRNFGPVVFLKSLGTPGSVKGDEGQRSENESNISNSYIDDAQFPRYYPNSPNVRVGGERLRIREDQAVFVPIIVAIETARKPYMDWGMMQDFTGLTIDYGDNPPNTNQLTINGEGIKLPKGNDLSKFRIMTPMFPVVVPDTDYGRSLKDFLEEPFPPGTYSALVEGYFVLFTFDPGRYIIHSWASAPRETRGPYFSELIYEIEVNAVGTSPSKGPVMFRPARNERIIKQIIAEKKKIGEIDKKFLGKFASAIQMQISEDE